MVRTALAVAVAVWLAGCAPDGREPVEVAYSIDGSTLECVHAAFQDERTDFDTGVPVTLCGWFCATFEGEASNEILLLFRYDASVQTWVRSPTVGRQSASPCGF